MNTNKVTDFSYVGTLYDASSDIRYGKQVFSDSIYYARAYGNKLGYGVNGANNNKNGHQTKPISTANGDDYHYFSGGNPLEYLSPSNETPKYYADKIDGNLTVEKPTEFGFQAKYMAYIRWTVTKARDDLWDGSVADTIYDIDGYMVSGFETEHNTTINSTDGDRTDDLPEIGTVDFNGAGMGTYHAQSGEGYRTAFDAKAEVDFAGTINLNLTNTQCVIGLTVCGALDVSGLDVSDALLNFTAGTNKILVQPGMTEEGELIQGVTTVGNGAIASMVGSVDARFYGQNRTGANRRNAAKEFGGAFSFRGSGTAVAQSYIGIFGTQRNYDGSFDKPTDLNKHNLTGFDDENRASTSGNALAMNAVAITTTKTGAKTITNENIADAVVEFDYISNGYFGWDGLRTYFDDKKYSATQTETKDEHNYIKDSSPAVLGSDVVPNEIGLTRTSFNFSFTPNYMALVTWKLDEDGYDTYGYGITGFEPDANSIIADDMDIVTFTTGQGRGRYSDATDNFNTKFSITAMVNFGMSKVTLTSTGTCDSSNCNSKKDGLNFTGDLNYTAGTNALVSDTNAITAMGGLTGTAQAKFYGANLNELGGTFNFSNATSGYVGWFGVKRSADYIAALDRPTENLQGITGFNDSNRNSKSNVSLTLDSAVQVTSDGGANVANENISDAVVALDYASDGDFADTGLELYVGDTQYIVNTGTGDAVEITSSAVTSSDANNATDIQLNRNKFGDFTANYMASLTWDMSEAGSNSNNYGIVGFASDVAIIPDASGATFTGKGQGTYSVASTPSLEVEFGVTAAVDFAMTKVTLTSNGTCDASVDCQANPHAHLDFVGDLSYTAGENALASVADGIATTGGLSGTANAKFYGANLDELGGTFNLSNATAGYVGWFGAERAYAGVLDAPTNLNKHNLTGFNDSSRKGKTGNILKMNAVEMTKTTADSVTTITNKDITDVTVAFHYVTNSTKFNWNGLEIYLDDRNYKATQTLIKDVHYLKDTSPGVVGTDKTPDEIGLIKNGSYFGYDTKYMAVVYWRLDEENYDNYGYGMVGFETAIADIPTTGTAVSFGGKGRGRYSTATSDTDTRFNITASANFEARTVSVTGTHTNGSPAHLNFTGTLGYAENSNELTGSDWATTGDGAGGSNPSLSGGADARFYGPDTDELGGTFNMSNADAGYVGFFGMKK